MKASRQAKARPAYRLPGLMVELMVHFQCDTFQALAGRGVTPPAQKVDILHKKLSLNGALCAKPVAGESDGWPLIISSPASIYPDT